MDGEGLQAVAPMAAPARDDDLAVMIAVPTLRRPRELARLLDRLPATIEAAIEQGSCARVDVVVIDNDPSGSAADVVRSASLPVRYAPEPQPGLSAVRNRALDESACHDMLVFIDDDETPAAEGWLARLLDTQRVTGAGVVAGPVRTVIEGEWDPWIVAGGFYARAHRSGLQTRDRIAGAATNNLLLDVAAVRRAGVRFDSRFGATGGEDSFFTAQLGAAGVEMVWCADANEQDHLLSSRQTRAHALVRSRGMAAAGVRVSLALAEGAPARRARVRARGLCAALTRIAVGSARGLGARVSGSTRLDAIGARDIARGVGQLEGVIGRNRPLYGLDGGGAPAVREETS